MSVQDNFFLPRVPKISMKIQSSKKLLRELLETPKWLVAAALLVDIKAQQQSGWNLVGWGQPPPNIGQVPSHVSVATHATAATSVVASSGYFIGATCWWLAEINAHRVISPMSAHGVLGSHDYTHHCTRPLGRPQGDMRGSMHVLSWGYKYYKVVKGVMVVIPKMEIMRLKVGSKNEDHKVCY